ncbi:unnamed protein product, partial [Didymodactylos carnosus]
MTSISSFGEQMTQNIQEAAQRKFDLSTVLEADQHRIFAQLQGLCGFEETPLFFCFMALLSHFSRDSYYLAYRTEDKKPINLYVVLFMIKNVGRTVHFKHQPLDEFDELQNSEAKEHKEENKKNRYQIQEKPVLRAF